MRDRNLQVAMCGSKLQCVCANPFKVETCDVCAAGTFLGLRSAIATLHVFSDIYALSFGVSYNSVAQKLRILTIKAIFDQKNPFLTIQ